MNLFWAIDRMRKLYESSRGAGVDQIRALLVAEAQLVKREDIRINEAIGRNGAGLVPDGKTVLTSLQCGGFGHCGIWHRTRCDPCGGSGGKED